ncbi:lysophospholipase [Oenococcus sp. UCMA 16435]|nr:lysophospholipase [Oenococcus sp. UCMA 16435]MDI4584744.1 lysophospholipase [Oenococcus sp. UCMA 14587]
MKEETQKLTKLDPRITEFQDSLREKYAEENKTAKKGQIDFVGSSLMEIFPIDKMQKDYDLGLNKIIYNRGVRATTTADLLQHIDTLIFDLAPSKIFINIGSNDIGFNLLEKTFLKNYDNILKQIKEKLPDTKVFVMAYYPMSGTGADFDDRSNSDLQTANEKVRQLAKRNGCQFINVNEGLTDSEGNLRAELTFDGVHMLPAGFRIVLKNLMRYI